MQNSSKEKKQLKEKCLKILREYTRHDFVKITHTGDCAIFAALFIAKQHGHTSVLIPDQGGWLSYKTFPAILKMKIKELKTNYGLLLQEEIKKYRDAVLLFSSFAGYAAPQRLEEIAEVCKENNIFMIEDASGALTHPTLCNGLLSDIIVGSFGKWKIVDVGYGGFLSVKKELITDAIKYSVIFSLLGEKTMDYELLLRKLKIASNRLQFILKKTQELKQKCKKHGFSLLHEKEEGLSIFVLFHDKKEKREIIDFCKEEEIPFKECPLYIKVLEKAISIEVKRLNV